MKTSIFYLLIFAPMLGLFLLGKQGLITPALFSGALMLYAFVYHPTIVGWRLLTKRLITPADFKKTYIPFWNQQFFREVFFS